MDREPRYELGLDIKTGSSVVENPRWMSETRARRLFRPVARFINLFKYEPLRDGLWPNGERGTHAATMSTYAGPGDGGMIGTLARKELNEADGLPLDHGLPKDALRPKDD